MVRETRQMNRGLPGDVRVQRELEFGGGKAGIAANEEAFTGQRTPRMDQSRLFIDLPGPSSGEHDQERAFDCREHDHKADEPPYQTPDRTPKGDGQHHSRSQGPQEIHGFVGLSGRDARAAFSHRYIMPTQTRTQRPISA